MNCKKCDIEFIPQDGLINYCSFKCRNSRTWSEADKLKKSISAKLSEKVKIANERIAISNTGKTKAILKEIICSVCNVPFKISVNAQKKYHAKCWRKVAGGYRKNSGNGKYGWYKGYWCQSSYELAFVIYNLEHNIKFEQNKDRFPYILNGESHYYLPDFKLETGEYVEIKGYMTDLVDIKLQSVNSPIIIYNKDTIQFMIDYAVEKYGKSFIELYEGNPYNKMTGNCKYCGNPCKEKSIFCSRSCVGKHHVKTKIENRKK